MTPIEIIALIFIIFALVKLVVIFINPMSWKSVVKKIYVKPVVTTAVGLVGMAVILRYLLEELTIVQIFASMTFMMALMMIQFSALGHEIVEMSDKFFNDRDILKKVWLSLALWIVLMGWVLYEIFV